MLQFGIIAEGVCDQTVIENLLVGYFQDEGDDLVVNPVQPLPDAPGGWTLVFASIKSKRPQEALQFNDYVIIHIDADVQEEIGFDVPRTENGKELSVADRVARITARLANEIDKDFLNTNRHRILFAVAIDAIECWLLPLLYQNNKAGKTVGCLESANYALRKTGRKGLSAGDEKFPRAYDEASREFRKRKTVLGRGRANPSLGIFIDQLDLLVATRVTTESEQGDEGGTEQGRMQLRDNGHEEGKGGNEITPA